MKIILDTNIIIAAFATHGLCHTIFELCLDRFEIVISEDILSETLRNLNLKIKLPLQQCESIVHFLRTNCTISETDKIDKSFCRDKSDLHVLGLAQHTAADYIVTGDNDLLELLCFKSTKILTPRDFWTMVKEKSEKSDF